MSELADFLLRRLAEEERTAWSVRHSGNASELLSPGRLLADCATRRKIIALHEVHLVSDGVAAILDGESGSCRAGENERDYVCPTLRLLALRYADHVEFQREWQVRDELITLVAR